MNFSGQLPKYMITSLLIDLFKVMSHPIDLVLILGIFGRAQRPAVLFGVLHAPCGPFQRIICARRPFLFASLCPSVSLSVSRLKGF